MNEMTFYDLKQAGTISHSMSVQVARELGRRIVAGKFEPGALIDDENALSERYQVSRVVIRDAVKILVSKGLLEVRRGIGTKVNSRNRWLMLDDDVLAWHLSAPPEPTFLKQLMEIRLAFEPKAARWAAERATDTDIANIEAAYQDMVKYEYQHVNELSVTKFIKADAMFHRAILIAAHNEFLQDIEGVIYSALLVSIRLTNKDPIENGTSLPFHYEVCQAISNRDGALAEQLTDRLLRDASERLQQQVDNKVA